MSHIFRITMAEAELFRTVVRDRDTSTVGGLHLFSGKLSTDCLHLFACCYALPAIWRGINQLLEARGKLWSIRRPDFAARISRRHQYVLRCCH
jgi:hypothetical protein